MEHCFMIFMGILAILILALSAKIYLLQKAAKEIKTGFAHRLSSDTNTLIDISSNDKYMRSLADDINIQLRELQKQRHQFLQGDMELKNAILNISHDLRTPLTAICGYLDLLEEEEKTENCARYLSVIGDRAQMMAQLTEELFQYSMVLAGEDKLQKEPYWRRALQHFMFPLRSGALGRRYRFQKKRLSACWTVQHWRVSFPIFCRMLLSTAMGICILLYQKQARLRLPIQRLA